MSRWPPMTYKDLASASKLRGDIICRIFLRLLDQKPISQKDRRRIARADAMFDRHMKMDIGHIE